ncbi:NAD(P)/FAD-dependent oxidoreductase [Chelativorans salis]|uniref:FAD-binding oxidoreductase n=1 Tax=Chelativorans salis TaxID=2978478 RepID=A0ABT2LST0_9HYPH|nr:FAD-binding oxidoreductase [Chelativorans sp. EGI FJ00035]MCT7377591.1 FAD-binding oxidoreductase [Chelativorans sp. EGI FJ00035]
MHNDADGQGLWAETAPPAPETAPLSGPLTADVAIVGGGFTGLSAALHLAEAGAKAVVLEGAEIGHGGSGRNVGLVNAGMWVMPEDLPRTLGDVYGERLLTLLGGAPRLVFDRIEKHAIACEPEWRGTLHCAVGKGGLRQLVERARQWQAHGAPVRLLDAGETAAKTGSNAYAGALLDERAGTLQPLAYARGLAGAAIAAGAQIFTRSPAMTVERDGARWRVTTPSGSVMADWVVAATNAYTQHLWPELRAEIVHLPYFNFATEPLDEALRKHILPEGQGAWDTNKVLTSFRMERQGRLVCGSVGALRGTGRQVHAAWARRTLRRLFPALEDVSFSHAWYGMIGMTNDHLPKFHRLAPNIVGFSGYNGRGIAPGTVFGQVLAQHILGALPEADLPLPVTPPRPRPLRALQEAGLEWGAQAVHLMRMMT